MISEALVDEIKNLSFRTDYPADRKLIVGLIEALLEVVPDFKRDQFNAGLHDGINLLRRTMFQDVNPSVMEVKIPFDEFKQYQDGSGVHLELGTYTAWPNDRADRYVRDNNLGDFVRLDMQGQFGPDIAASVTALPFADESIDRISSNSLMEHCPYPHEILKEAFRVLRPGGSILTIVPFHFVEHGCPKDYLRFTGQFFEDVCKDLGYSTVHIDTSSTSGIFYITHQMLKAGVINEQAPLASPLAKIHTALMALLAMLQGFDKSFHTHGSSLWHTTYALAVKPGNYRPRAERFDRRLPFYKRFIEHLVCPVTGLPVRDGGDHLESVDGKHRYPIDNAIPNMFALHGFGSGVKHRASSLEAKRAWEGTRGQKPASRPANQLLLDMLSERDYLARGWNVIPSFSRSAQVPGELLDEMEQHPEAAGKSSWGTRNLLFSLILSLRPKLVLEIGAHIGSASIVMGAALKANNFGKLICLEPQNHYFELLGHFIRKAGVDSFVTPLKILSTELNPETHLKSAADIIFLDANHAYSHALKDIELSYSFLADNGLIILDDVGPTHSAQICGEGRGGVRQALLDYADSHKDLHVIFLEPPFWLNPCGIALVCKQSIT